MATAKNNNPAGKTETKTAAKAPAKAAPAKAASAAPAKALSAKVKARTAASLHGAGTKRKSKTAIAPLSKDLTGTKTGVVESDSRPQTRRVVVAYSAKHPKYGKYIRQRTILHVHDEKNESRVGDVVEVAQCRPLSATKTWRLVRVVDKRSALAAALASAKSIGEAKPE
jgi:small subunit ribosomal protein S17